MPWLSRLRRASALRPPSPWLPLRSLLVSRPLSVIAAAPAQSRSPQGAKAGHDPAHQKNGTLQLSQLPETSVKLNFRSLPYTPEAMAITSIQPAFDKVPRRQTGTAFQAKEARRQTGLHPFQAPQAASWSCEHFTIRAIPPPYPEYRKKPSSTPSPFLRLNERVSKRDFGTPPPALDYLSLQDTGVSQSDRIEIQENMRHKVYTMDLTIVAYKKSVHKLAHVRNKIRTRLRGAIRLAVQQGVVYDSETGEYVHGKCGVANWLLPGHIYVFHTTLEVYNLPGHELHERVCAGLQAVKTLGQTMLLERTAEEELEQHTLDSELDMKNQDHSGTPSLPGSPGSLLGSSIT